MLNMSNDVMQVDGNSFMNQSYFINKNSFVKMLFVILSAIVANANSPEEIEEFAYTRKKWIKKNIYEDFIGLNGELVCLLLGSIRPDAMSEMVERWLREVAHGNYGQDSVGEEAVEKSFILASGFAGLSAAWVCASGGGLGIGKRQTDVGVEDGKFVANVINLFDIAEMLVSIDADGVHPDVAADVLGRGGDYLVSVRNRQKKFFNDLILLFNYGMINKDIYDYSFTSYYDDSSASEILSFDIINDMFWIQESNIYKDAKSVIRVVSTRIGENRTKTEARYYVSSAEISPQDTVFFKKDFWFYRDDKLSVLDVSTNQNKRDARTDHAHRNLASLRDAVLKLLENGSSSLHLVDGIRKKAAWDGEFLSRLLVGNIRR